MFPGPRWLQITPSHAAHRNLAVLSASTGRAMPSRMACWISPAMRLVSSLMRWATLALAVGVNSAPGRSDGGKRNSWK